jgi:predicted O-methyltransferase YrrM
MKKNVIVSEAKFLLDQKIRADKIKKKYISFQYLTNIIIITLLIFNLYYTIKFINYQKSRDIKLSNNENISNKHIYIYQKDKGTEQENTYIKINNSNESIYFNNISLEKSNLNNLNLIRNKIKNYAELTQDEQNFIYELIKTLKPKKIVEIGVFRGGSTAIILNAIKDIKNSKLFSIDKSNYCYKEKNKKTGYLIPEKFPELMDKWALYTGGITAKFIESIKDEIDLVFIDTVHSTPGEMLDWLMVLPFLKNESIVIFHDTFYQYRNNTIMKKKIHTSNNLLLCYIRGDLILPHYGNSVFYRNIGALKLATDQKKYYYQYFLALGIQWEYMPTENELKLMREFFMKYYGKKYVEVYDDAVEKNKIYLTK